MFVSSRSWKRPCGNVFKSEQLNLNFNAISDLSPLRVRAGIYSVWFYCALLPASSNGA